jgi:hypothetical protein
MAPTGKPFSRAFRGLAGLAAAGCLVLLFPLGSAGGKLRDKDRTALPPDLALIPSDAFGFIHVRVGEGEKAAVKRLIEQFQKDRPGLKKLLEKRLGVPLEDVERLAVLLVSPNDDQPLWIVTTARPYDRDKLLKALVPGPKKNDYRGTVYYTSKKAGRTAVQPVNDCLFVTGQVEDLVQNLVFLARRKREGPLRPALRQAAKDRLLTAGLQILPRLRASLRAELLRNARTDLLRGALAHTAQPVLPAQALALTLGGKKGPKFKLRLIFPDEDSAQRALWPVKDGLALVRMVLRAVDARAARDPGLKALRPLVRQLEMALRSASVDQSGKRVRVVVPSRIAMPRLIASGRSLIQVAAYFFQLARRHQK